MNVTTTLPTTMGHYAAAWKCHGYTRATTFRINSEGELSVMTPRGCDMDMDVTPSSSVLRILNRNPGVMGIRDLIFFQL
jgi:hypothetical protein